MVYGHFPGGNFQSVFSCAVAERLEGGGRGCGKGVIMQLNTLYIEIKLFLFSEYIDKFTF